MQLSERQERILKTIVETYITTAHAVGSAAIVEASRISVSSATVRNEMSILEALGYIQHLHTSGGRVPTNVGYRYYVEKLMDLSPLPQTDAHTIRHQFLGVHAELSEWLKLAVAVMAHRMRNVGLITAPRSPEARVRHIQVISMEVGSALLILVLQDGVVLREKLTLSEPQSQDELSMRAHRLTAHLQGLSGAQVERMLPTLDPRDTDIASLVARLLHHRQEQVADVYHTGLADLILQPEFVGNRPGETSAALTGRLRPMVEFLQAGWAVERLVQELPVEGDVQVMIGAEAIPGLDDYSFVIARYGTRENSSGYLGIIGPTRMQYPRAVSLVRYMTDLLSDLMQA